MMFFSKEVSLTILEGFLCPFQFFLFEDLLCVKLTRVIISFDI